FPAPASASGRAPLPPASDRGALGRIASPLIAASKELPIPLLRSARPADTPPLCAPSGCWNAPPAPISASAARCPEGSSTAIRRSDLSEAIASHVRHSFALPCSIGPYHVLRSATHGSRSRSSNGRARYPVGRLAVRRSVSTAITGGTIRLDLPASNRAADTAPGRRRHRLDADARAMA